MPISCAPILLDAIRELEADRDNADRLASRKLQDAISRLAGNPAGYERLAAAPPTADAFARIRARFAEDIRSMLDTRISELRKLCEAPAGGDAPQASDHHS